MYKKGFIVFILIVIFISSVITNFFLLKETNSLKNRIGHDYAVKHSEVIWNFDVEFFDHYLNLLRAGDDIPFERYSVKISSLSSSHRLGSIDVFFMMLSSPLNNISKYYYEGDIDAMEESADLFRERLKITHQMLVKIDETLGGESNKTWFEEINNTQSELNEYISNEFNNYYSAQGTIPITGDY